MMANLQLTSTLRPSGEVEIALAESAMPEPGEGEIVVEMIAAPLHPTDMGLLFAAADPGTAERVTRDGRTITVLQAAPGPAMAQRRRWDKALPVGTEGAGRVVSAGPGDEAQALLGRFVAIWGGGMYTRYRKLRAADALALPDGTSAAEGAAAFVNPLTALGMIETMRDEGFTALVHTAAASTLGQMLSRLCEQEKIGLVNIVRQPEQVELLRSIGAEHVCSTGSPSFEEDLLAALRATGATLAFDAIGGGRLASQILAAMEQVCAAGGDFRMYGSDISKKVYIYGGLDRGPVELFRNYGSVWDVGGWLLFPFLKRIGPERAERLKQRVAGELKSTFVMTYSQRISLQDVCDPEMLRAAARKATGEKYLLNLQR